MTEVSQVPEISRLPPDLQKVYQRVQQETHRLFAYSIVRESTPRMWPTVWVWDYTFRSPRGAEAARDALSRLLNTLVLREEVKDGRGYFWQGFRLRVDEVEVEEPVYQTDTQEMAGVSLVKRTYMHRLTIEIDEEFVLLSESPQLISPLPDFDFGFETE